MARDGSHRDHRRDAMVKHQIASRGIRNEGVLEAMRSVLREEFVGEEVVEFAYEDSALPIAADQTISQPYIVALMAEALEIAPTDRVLEVGAGSGYAAAVLAHLADRVFAVERHRPLADSASRTLERLGYSNVEIRHADGTLGWEEEAPFDAILVSAGGTAVPPALIEQLAPGGRMVIPVGEGSSVQDLLLLRKADDGSVVRRSSLGGVRFVPLLEDVEDGGSSGEGGGGGSGSPGGGSGGRRSRTPLERLRKQARPFETTDDPPVDDAVDRLAGHTAVLLGEASHGTSEFYTLRERLTRRLIERGGIDFVAVEADWPDAAHLDRFVRGLDGSPSDLDPFSRFPRWMWANEETLAFLRWLRDFNETIAEPEDRVGFFGLDLYSLNSSIDAVQRYLDDIDPEVARLARDRFSCLTPWQNDPQTYGRLASTGRMEACEDGVVEMLGDLLDRRLEYARADGLRYLDAVENARLVANAERYYRTLYRGPTASWNLRDQHMFDTLRNLLTFHGPESATVVWAHNSHLGDASATEMGARGQHNLGQLCRNRLGSHACLVGMGTHEGTVMAATDWGDEGEVMTVRPSHPESYERLSHDAEMPAFFLPITERDDLYRDLARQRLERAIGVIYRPETERASHYFHASLPRQFDEWIFFDRTSAVSPLEDLENRTPASDPFLH